MRLTWDGPGEKRFEAGVDHGVYYPQNETGEYTPGVAWNGLISVAETPEGAEPTSQYADNIKYFTMRSAEELNGTIEAYTYPPEWNQSDGNAELMKGVYVGQQGRKPFGLCYRTKVGNDVDGQDAGYKYHLVYGATASPSERTYESINDSPDGITFSWEFSTNPVNVTGHNPTALLVIDTTMGIDQDKLNALLDILYGTDATGADEGGTTEGTAPRLPLPDEVLSILTGNSANAVAARMASRVRGR